MRYEMNLKNFHYMFDIANVVWFSFIVFCFLRPILLLYLFTEGRALDKFSFGFSSSMSLVKELEILRLQHDCIF